MAKNLRWIGQSDDGETVTLRKFNGNFNFKDTPSEEWVLSHKDQIKTGLVVDLETTGLDVVHDHIIEIGMRSFQFHKGTGELIRLGQAYSALNDPHVPLSQTVQIVTGLTDEDLKGKSIDWKVVDDMIEKSDLLIAHNASFDRPILERYTLASARKPWACSLSQINWLQKGYPVSKLEILCVYHGFFTDAHRALNDCDALLYLISMEDQISQRPYLHELLKSARQPIVQVSALSAPFETKDLLKSRSYRWHPRDRYWYKVISREGAENEVAWLESAVYKGQFQGRVHEIPITDRFKRLP